MSDYIKQDFISGQILKAEHLNHIEEGLVELSNKIDDTSVQTKEETVDMLTSNFNLSGSIIKCNPIANTKVEISAPEATKIYQSTKNLFTEHAYHIYNAIFLDWDDLGEQIRFFCYYYLFAHLITFILSYITYYILNHLQIQSI